MEIYIITITLSLFLSFVGMHCKTRVLQKICIGLIVVICSLMPGLRDISVGTDSLMYANFLVVDRSYHDWLVSGIAIEPGFVFLIKLYQFIGFTNYAYFFFGVAIIFNYLVISTIFKLSPNPLISVLSLLTFSTIYFFHFNVIRASLALAVFLYSVPYILERKYKKAYVIIAISVLFHISGLIFLFIPLAYKYLRKKPLLVTFGSIAFTGVYSASSLILSFLGNLIGTTKYSSYSAESNIGGGFFAIYFILALLSIFSLINRKIRENDLHLFCVYFICMSALTWFCIIFLGLRYEGPGRVVVYFYIGSIFIFSTLLQMFTYTSRLVLSVLILALCLVMAYYIFVIKGVYGVFPYTFNTIITKTFEFL
ncbi:EpsG family protein [Klebsiella pneumoniae]|uniref:EpsG family protein n=1 Tax=Klebsiella pneumoniae TaxID=573 RepID=UPI0023810C2A|nr:EpsG family protein [Klebsiella pneumoniae]MDE4776821.1 EpsG family protein [Klebsiella pneumoniae]